MLTRLNRVRSKVAIATVLATSLSLFAPHASAAASRKVEQKSEAHLAPALSGTPSKVAYVGTSYSFRPTAIDGNGDNLTFRIRNKPAWASFDPATGALTGTPTVAGVYPTIQIRATDGKFLAFLPVFTITVVNAPSSQAPVAQTPVTQSPPASSSPAPTPAPAPAPTPDPTPVTQTPPASSTPTPVVATTPDPTPAPTPTPDPVPAPVNHAPTISGTAVVSGQVDQPYAFQPTAADADGDKLTYSIKNKPSWATFDAEFGTLYGTPTSTSVGTYSNVVISVSDGTNTTALAAFAITINPSPTKSVTLNWTAPVANTDGTILNDLTGYKVFYGSASGQYTASVDLPGAGVNSAVLEGLKAGTWYFSIKSVNSAGVESDYSGEVSTVLL
jgi:hypothetical protein